MDKKSREFIEKNVPDGHVLLAMPQEDLKDLLCALAAAKSMFVIHGVKDTPAGLTEEKVDRLAALLAASGGTPEMSGTRLHSPPDDIH